MRGPVPAFPCGGATFSLWPRDRIRSPSAKGAALDRQPRASSSLAVTVGALLAGGISGSSHQLFNGKPKASAFRNASNADAFGLPLNNAAKPQCGSTLRVEISRRGELVKFSSRDREGVFIRKDLRPLPDGRGSNLHKLGGSVMEISANGVMSPPTILRSVGVKPMPSADCSSDFMCATGLPRFRTQTAGV